MAENNISRSERLTISQKEANDKKYYRDKIDSIDAKTSTSYGGISEYKRRKVNYDLYNGIIDPADFEYVCKPYGAEAGEMPAEMSNKDIVSPRIKAVEGMEMKRPLPWKPLAINRDATTRKETEETSRIKEYVIAQITGPIEQKIREKHAEQLKNGKLTDEEKKKIEASIAEELQAATPDRVRKYMEREHQDPSEVLAQQILMYLMQEQRIPEKFSKGWKHVLLSAYEVYFVGIMNKKPIFKVINPIRFEYDRNSGVDFIEDGGWAGAEYRMTPEQVVRLFGDELTDKQIDDLYENYAHYAEKGYIDNLFDFSQPDGQFDESAGYVRVFHANWKGLREMGFLTYIDKDGMEQLDVVDENYKLNPEAGDVSIDWEWLEETYQGYRIGSDIYVGMGPVEGQFRDINTMRDPAKLQYYGTSYDDDNSQPTSMMDRMKSLQYFHNIAMYRLELLMASDKGKKVLMNLGAIPKSQGIGIKKWQHFLDTSSIMWYTKDEEGQYTDANSVAKVIDLSLVSDIKKYIEIADYLEKKCGKTVGIPDELIGDISASAEVGNTKQQVAATSNILEPMFHLHSQVQRNCLQAMIEAAKVAYSEHDPGILSYILDDLSYAQFEVDQDLLEGSSIGIFVANSGKADEAKETIKQLSHAAMQNDKVELSDVVALIRQSGTQEAEEILKAGEKKRKEEMAKEAAAERQARQEELRIKGEQDERAHQREIEKITLQEQLKTDRELKKQAMLSIGFNENKDMDGDGELDVLEVAREGIDADIRLKELDQRKAEFDHQKKVDKKELQIKEKTANKPKSK
jgi:hypothetical protein